MFFINCLVFIFFAVTYFLSAKFNIDWIKILPGILLLYYLPGHNLNSILFNKRGKFVWYFRLALDVTSSLSIFSILYFIFSRYIFFIEFRLVLFVLIINLILAVIEASFNKKKTILKKLNLRQNIKRFYFDNKKTLLILAIPFGLLILRVILNPFIYDIDSLIYFDAFQVILKNGFDFQQIFSGARIAFPFFMMSSDYVAGLGYIAFFKFFVPLIFYFTSIILLVFFEKNKKTQWAYLLILASPMLIIANETVRPETIGLVFTIPALTLAYLSLKNNDKIFAFLAFFYAFAAFRFHESGFLLLVAVLTIVPIYIIRNAKIIFQFLMKNLGFVIIILAGGVLLYKTILKFFSTALGGGFTLIFLGIIARGLSKIKWDWWFIDNFTTYSGAIIGWPGYTAVLYYLYNGILLLFFALLIFTFFLLVRRKTRAKNSDFSWVPLVPLFFFFAMHFIYAEILPRLGIKLLSNRSWPYIMLALAIISIILIVQIFQLKVSQVLRKLIIFSLTLTVVSGVIGSMFGSTFMGAMVLTQEKKAIQAIRELPQDSIIVSTQRNQNLVKIYGKKDFLQIEQSKFDKDNFTEGFIKQKMEASVQDTIDRIMLAISVKESIKKETKINNKEKFSEVVSEQEVWSQGQRMGLIKSYDPDYYEFLNTKFTTLESFTNKNIYFLYSFAKLDHGILRTRPWWRISSDNENYQFFKGYTNNTLYKDQNFILIKLK